MRGCETLEESQISRRGYLVEALGVPFVQTEQFKIKNYIIRVLIQRLELSSGVDSGVCWILITRDQRV
jgi:hypothetical protein